MKELRCKVVSRKELKDKFHLLEVKLEKSLGANVTPAQFAMLSSGNGDGLLLRRPYSILDVKGGKKADRLSFFFKEVGKGTASLGRAKAGDHLSLLAPLGKGFDLKQTKNKVVCIITGGIGVAPFYIFLKEIKKFKPKAVYMFYGARSKKEFFFGDFFGKKCDRLLFSTDDGSKGYKGLVTGLFEKTLSADPVLSKALPDEVSLLTCGPSAMMRRVGEIALDRGYSCYVSLEEAMGCGFGVCLSCVVKSRKTGAGNLTVCKDGPVFDIRNVQF